MTSKACNICKLTKSLDDFYKHRSYPDGHQYSCKPCWNAYQYSPERKVKQNRKNMATRRSSKRATYLREYRLKKNYGITIADYNQKLLDQNGKCGICNCDHSSEPVGLYVDHDHESGKVRDLLCKHCNHGIGSLREDISILESAIAYLKKHKSNNLSIVKEM